MEMAYYEHSITIPYAQPYCTPTKSMDIKGANIPMIKVKLYSSNMHKLKSVDKVGSSSEFIASNSGITKNNECTL